MTAAALMLQGTGSDVGKSLLAAGLCRAYTRRGLRVRPFKPQNMSNNAAVTEDGGEIGRAQALQARACGVAPTVDMNPVLLKPQTDLGSQAVVHGVVWRSFRADEYYGLKSQLLPRVMESFDRLTQEGELVIVEGAGSPAEVNLRAGDIANMGFAQAGRVPVVLVGDIERGGVIASLVGTHALLEAEERELLGGCIINRFRGDVRLFDGGLDVIRERTGLRCYGVVPYFSEARKLPAEDSMAVGRDSLRKDGAAIRVLVPVLSRIANFDDLDPLLAEPDVDVRFIEAGAALPGDADLIVLPGSKSTIGDLRFLRDQGWDVDIAAHLRRGGWLLGLCAGYQMLGRTIADPDAVEGEATCAQGLDLLDLHTVVSDSKTLLERKGIDLVTGSPVHGYEMHMGVTSGPDTARPFLELGSRTDGSVSSDGKVMGCYLHGLFADDRFRAAFLARIRDRRHSGIAYEAQIELTLDALASHLETHLDLDALLEVASARFGVKPDTATPLSTQRPTARQQ